MPSPGSTTITITVPPKSTWTSDLHWHETHTEYLRVVKGRAAVTLGDSTTTRGASDQVIRVEQFQIHEWKRANDDGNEHEAEDLVVEEWTEPADGQKEVFFRNLNSVIVDQETEKPWGLPVDWWVEWQILAIGSGADNYPAFGGRGATTRLLSHVVLFLATTIGALFGVRVSYPEYGQLPRSRVERRKEI